MSIATVRTTVVLPADTARELQRLVPTRKRSAFIAKAIEASLMHIRFAHERECAYGAWKDEDYAHLQTAEDMAEYITSFRSEDDWRKPATGDDEG